MRDKIVIIIHFRLCPEFCLFNTPVILPTNQNKIYTQGMNLIKSELTTTKAYRSMKQARYRRTQTFCCHFQVQKQAKFLKNRFLGIIYIMVKD